MRGRDDHAPRRVADRHGRRQLGQVVAGPPKPAHDGNGGWAGGAGGGGPPPGVADGLEGWGGRLWMCRSREREREGGREREGVRRAGAAACLMRLGGACAFFVRARIFPVFFRSRHPPHSSASTPTLPLTLSVSCRHVMVGRDGASDAVVDARQRQRTTTAATAVGAGAPRKSARLTSPRRMIGERRGWGR